MQPVSQDDHFLQYQGGELRLAKKPVPAEALLMLNVNGQTWLTFTCTPSEQEALAAGFLFNEGVIETAAEIASLHLCAAGDLLEVWLTHAAEKPAEWTRTSGCSGGQTGQPATANLPPGAQFSPEAVIGNMEDMLRRQDSYRASGGLHCSALADLTGIQLVAEDIGRHNTLDKLAGMLLHNPIQIEPRMLLTTGRVSSEMLQKAARMQAVVVVSRTSPTALSIELAEQSGIALVGYARHAQFNLYTHPERMRLS